MVVDGEAAERVREEIAPLIRESLEPLWKYRDDKEPERVAKFVKAFPEVVNSKIAPRFIKEKWRVSSRGVFVHGRPKVAPTDPQEFPEKKPESVEIGDLLIVARGSFGLHAAQTALLLQAKRITRERDLLRNANANQAALYASWPEFRYDTPIFLKGAKRYLGSPPPHHGTKYLLFDSDGSNVDNCFGYSPFRKCSFASPPDSAGIPCLSAEPARIGPFRRHRDFAEELMDMLFVDAGCRYESPGDGDTGWNQFIADILRFSAAYCSKYMRNGTEPGRCGQGSLCFLSGDPDAMPDEWTSAKKMYDDARTPVPPDRLDESDEGGFSVISLTVQAAEPSD